ncbi:MAG: Delta(1)-pyrroline-2-carboxylate reductase [Syntrophus sp. SKADARSKE-3]|nr:Delta(1)-pyrroline-2-carboxylate reductase [Syntrophus sp. SKADARSKE-3]
MQILTDAEVAKLVNMKEAITAMTAAFEQFGKGTGAILARNRASATHDGKTAAIASMGAALPASGVVGTKVYSTIDGKFNFVIVLFSASTGDALCTMAAKEITRFRTAAASTVAMKALTRKDAKTLSVFGTGVQANAHVEAFLLSHAFERVLVAGRKDTEAFAERIRSKFGIKAVATDMATAAAEADVIATCTRAFKPLFDGNLVKPGTFIAAIGTSKPQARELDDTLLARAARIIVEWRPAAQAEAGEFAQAAPGVIDPARVDELGMFITGQSQYIRHEDDIVIYKAVGIGLEDIALANLVWQRAR